MTQEQSSNSLNPSLEFSNQRMAFINTIGNILKQTSHKLQSLEPSVPNASFYQAIRCLSSSKLFIGGLSFTTDENSLREAFLPYGDVVEARVIFDRESGRSRGFGFVSYASSEEASSAIQALDGRDLHGRSLRVAYASDQRRTSPGPSFSGASGYGDSSAGSDGLETVSSHTSSKFSCRDRNNTDGAHGGNYISFGNTGFGNTGEYYSGNCSRANTGIYEGFSAHGIGAANYTADSDSFKTHNVSNGAGGNHYLQNAGNNFGGNPGDGYARYGAAFGGGSFNNGSHGSTGNFSCSGDVNGIADSYNTTNNRINSFDNQTAYNTIRQENNYWQGQNFDTSNNFTNQDETRGNIYDTGISNSRDSKSLPPFCQQADDPSMHEFVSRHGSSSSLRLSSQICSGVCKANFYLRSPRCNF